MVGHRVLDSRHRGRKHRCRARIHNRLTHPLRQPNQRRSRSRGDGFFVSFEDADHALSCAVEIQRTLTEHRRGHGFSPSVRIGLHTCAAIRRGSGYQGKGVHTAARIGAHAQNGEIIASAETLAGIETGLPISERRTVKLKGIAAPVELAAILRA